MTKREEAEQAMRMRVREDSTALVSLLREAINEAFEEAAKVADRAEQETSAEVARCNPDDVSGHLSYWTGKNASAAQLREAIRALKKGAT